jgi:hypothetical protein
MESLGVFGSEGVARAKPSATYYHPFRDTKWRLGREGWYHPSAGSRPELEKGNPLPCAFGLVLKTVPRLRCRVGINTSPIRAYFGATES